MKKYIKYIYVGVLLSVIITPARAQVISDITPATLERIELNNTWQKTDNAAGAVWTNTPKYSYVNAGYQFYDGNFRRLQQGQDGSNINFNAVGNLILNKTKVFGFFSYNHDNINGSQYNASIIDPYRGMPFYVADTVVSNWRNQHYDMGFRVAHPLNNHWAIGLEGLYSAVLGAKQMDPRTLNKQMTLVIKPSVIYSFNEKNHIGATFQYYNTKEESSMTNENSLIDQNYYAMYGLGTAIKGIGSGRITNYDGNDVGGAIQYQHQGFFNVLLEGGYNLKVEDAKITFDRPRYDSSVRDNIWKGMAIISKTCGLFENFFNITYINRHIDGIQYINQYNTTSSSGAGWDMLYKSVRSKYETNDIKADYTLLKKRENEYMWKTNLSVLYLSQKDEYLLPYSDMKYKNIKFDINGKYNFILSNKLTKRLLTGLDLFYNKNLSGEYNYGGSHANYLVVTQFETSEINYMKTNFYGLNISAVYSQRVKKDLKADIYLKTNYYYAKTKDFDFSHRSLFEFSFGCNF